MIHWIGLVLSTNAQQSTHFWIGKGGRSVGTHHHTLRVLGFRQLIVGSTMLRSFGAPGPSRMRHCISTNALDTICHGYSAKTRSLLVKEKKIRENILLIWNYIMVAYKSLEATALKTVGELKSSGMGHSISTYVQNPICHGYSAKTRSLLEKRK